MSAAEVETTSPYSEEKKHASLDRSAIVAHARKSIGIGSKSFSLASKLFDPQIRERAWLLYAWCRHCDDLADGQVMGHGMSNVPDGEARMAEIRLQTHAALAERGTIHPAFAAIGIVARECALPHSYINDIIEGFALDVREWQPRTENDLYQYCYHVAGAVGRLMAIIMGVAPGDTITLNRATDLGLAFQLANIARDLEEDDAAGRCYIPQEWLAEMDIPPGQHMKPLFRSRLVVLAKRLCEGAELYEASARVGAEKLPFRSRWAVLAAAGIYGDIARKVRLRGPQAWDHRTVTSAASKLGWIMRAMGQSRRDAIPVDRNALWTYRK